MTQILLDAHEAAARLDDGALVAIPTETVYGLAADARNPQAVSRVFAVKGRPASHPVIVHLAKAEDADVWAAQIDPRLAALMRQHWPGPLTVVVPKAEWVSDVITGGQKTVALRVPAHALAQQVIADLGEMQGAPAGVVAPSANRFGQVSPTTAAHVEADLGTVLSGSDAILDGGPCAIGVESTVVAVVADQLRVLRPGAVAVPEAEGARSDEADAPRVPGALPAHYAPSAKVVVISEPELPELQAELRGRSVALIAPEAVGTPQGWIRVGAPRNDAEYARDLYAGMRGADEHGVGVLVAIAPRHGPLAPAVRDRLLRAAAAGTRPR